MLQLRNITNAYEGETVLRGIDLSVEPGEILCLLGPSGSGKTTVLRIIAGLINEFGGDVVYQGESIRDVPVHQRDIGLMFQDFALFPHLTVAQNVDFGLRMKKLPSDERAKRIHSMLSLVGLPEFGNRDVSALSGGEQQRVALARSLAPRPRLLLLDEPLGSLDAALRQRLAMDLRQIIKQVGLTALYVTHDQEEAYAVADRIALVHQGRIEQLDRPEVLYWQPATRFTAQFLGLHNIFRITQLDRGFADTVIGRFAISEDAQYILFHPDRVILATGAGTEGRVVERIFRGDHYQVMVRINSEASLLVRCPSYMQVPEIGSQVTVQVPSEAVIPLKS